MSTPGASTNGDANLQEPVASGFSASASKMTEGPAEIVFVVDEQNCAKRPSSTADLIGFWRRMAARSDAPVIGVIEINKKKVG